MTKNEMLKKINKEFIKSGFSSSIKGDRVGFDFSNKIQPDIQVAVMAEAKNGSSFKLAFIIPFSEENRLSEIQDYILSHKIEFSEYMPMKEHRLVFASKILTPDCIGILPIIISEVMLNVVPFIVKL